MTDLIDREIGSLTGFLNGIAISHSLREGDPLIVHRVVEVARERGFQSMGFFDTEGHARLLSPASPDIPFITADKAGVSEVLAGKPVFVSDLQVLPSGRPGLFYLSVPVVVDGQVAFVLTGGVQPRQMQGLFAEAGLREEWGAGMVDRTGIFIARSRSSATYVGHPALQPMVDVVRSGKPEGLVRYRRPQRTAITNAFRRSAITGGGYIVIVVPSQVVNAPFWLTMQILGVVSLALILLSVGLGLLVARRIARDVNNLGHAVVAYASGDVVPLPTATLTELRDVLRVVEAAAAVEGDRAVRRRPSDRV